MKHADHEDQFWALIESSEDPGSAFQASPWASCEECRAAFEDVKMLDDRFKENRDTQRSVLNDASTGRAVPGEASFVAHLKGLLDAPAESQVASELSARPEAPALDVTLGELASDSSSHGSSAHASPSSRPWRWIATAAAILVLLWGAWPSFWPSEPEGGSETPGDTLLGSSMFTAATPQGATKAWGGFEWSGEFPTDAWFEVLVYTKDDVLLVESGELEVNRWQPDPEITAAWPERIRWDVRLFSSSFSVPESSTVEAWLEAP